MMRWVDLIIIFFIGGVFIATYIDFSSSNSLNLILFTITFSAILFLSRLLKLKKYTIFIISYLTALLLGISYNVNYNLSKLKINLEDKNISSKIIQHINKNYPNGGDANFILALIYGNKNNISKNQKQTYSKAGAMHILALSGLHTGIIYTLINIFLFFLKYSYNSKLIKIIIQSIFLLFYCYITGFTASALRATIMIICFSIIKFYCRGSSKYTTLLFTALILLIINPNNISSIGFILSFCAMIGIIIINPIIIDALNIYKIRSILSRYFIGIISITISCQITTLPITLYIFKNFPPFYIITNLIAIPLATLIIYFYFISELLSPIPYVGDFFRNIVSILIYTINNFISFAAS